jgi:hypothetical protein
MQGFGWVPVVLNFVFHMVQLIVKPNGREVPRLLVKRPMLMMITVVMSVVVVVFVLVVVAFMRLGISENRQGTKSAVVKFLFGYSNLKKEEKKKTIKEKQKERKKNEAAMLTLITTSKKLKLQLERK